MVGSPDALRALVEPLFVSSDLELWDLEMTPDTIRLLVDRPGGVDLDALAAFAGKVVSPVLDEHPELTPAGHFSLEVSSPGVERTLRRPEHYARYIGAEVSVKTTVAVDGARRHRGVLVSADGEGIVVQPQDGPEGRTVTIRHDQIERARTVLVWGPAEKPGKKRKHPAKPEAHDKAVKRPAANGRSTADQPVASREKDAE